MPLLTAGPSKFLGGGRSPWYRAGGAPLPVAAYQPKGAASLAASYVNLANPGTYDATSASDPTFATATGWQFNGAGASGNLVTVALASDPTATTVIVAGKAITNTTAGGRFYDATSANTKLMVPIINISNRAFQNGGSLFQIAGAQTNVNCVMAMAGNNAYLNGVDEAINLAAVTAITAMTFGNRAARDRTLNGYIYAIAIYSSVLTADQIAAVSAAMAAL